MKENDETFMRSVSAPAWNVHTIGHPRERVQSRSLALDALFAEQCDKFTLVDD